MPKVTIACLFCDQKKCFVTKSENLPYARQHLGADEKFVTLLKLPKPAKPLKKSREARLAALAQWQRIQ